LRLRHVGLVLSFLLFVLAPIGATAWYLWTRAADQYASTVGFSVQREQMDPSMSLLGGLTSLTSSSSADTDILYEYMFSQALVAELDAELDLRALWSKPADDPWFRFHAPGTIEDLTEYWADMVKVFYDNQTRIIEVRVLAFDPDDAQAIAVALYDRSTRMVNDLAETAREDSLRYAKEELEESTERLRAARTAVTAFRNRYQLVDPQADVASQSGLVATLQQQLANALIELDLLRLQATADDPRIPPAERRVQVIEARIEAEREKLGGTGGRVYADIVAEYEGLAADREFAEAAYRAALTSFDAARAEARRQNRYLAAHVAPTRAEAARYPEREVILGVVALLALTGWAIAAMLYYSLRDRR
jgi:capsular polysaccharide transport system permease protein